MQSKSRDTLNRYLQLSPVIDSVEGEFIKTEGVSQKSLRLVGKVPPDGKAPGGVLRHKGWKADKVDLPKTEAGAVLAPAEIEIE